MSKSLRLPSRFGSLLFLLTMIIITTFTFFLLMNFELGEFSLVSKILIYSLIMYDIYLVYRFLSKIHFIKFRFSMLNIKWQNKSSVTIVKSDDMPSVKKIESDNILLKKFSEQVYHQDPLHDEQIKKVIEIINEFEYDLTNTKHLYKSSLKDKSVNSPNNDTWLYFLYDLLKQHYQLRLGLKINTDNFYSDLATIARKVLEAKDEKKFSPMELDGIVTIINNEEITPLKVPMEDVIQSILKL